MHRHPWKAVLIFAVAARWWYPLFVAYDVKYFPATEHIHGDHIVLLFSLGLFSTGVWALEWSRFVLTKWSRAALVAALFGCLCLDHLTCVLIAYCLDMAGLYGWLFGPGDAAGSVLLLQGLMVLAYLFALILTALVWNVLESVRARQDISRSK